MHQDNSITFLVMIVVSTTLAQTDISQYLYFTDMDFYLFIFFTDIQSGGRSLLIFAISEFSCCATMRLSFFCFHSNNSISIEWIAMEFDIYVPQLNPNVLAIPLQFIYHSREKIVLV